MGILKFVHSPMKSAPPYVVKFTDHICVYTFVYSGVIMTLLVSGFDWDDGNRAKCQKHGVSIVEVEALFGRGPRIAPDPKHSADEDRLIAVGKTNAGRPLFVAFTMRTRNGRRLVRPVTARYMHAREIAAYEEAVFEKAAHENKSATPKNR
jgi:uncharacterized DUF497 family protein